jgi:hypothetical protein
VVDWAYLGLSNGWSVTEGTPPVSESRFDPHQLGVEAYLYLYPLVTMEVSRRQVTNVAAGQLPGRAPVGQFAHIPAFPAADFKAVVRPNFDTLYSSAWLDLSSGPVILSAPDTGGRYYLLPVYDMWTDVFAAPGWRTTGTGEQHHALIPPGWSGSLPAAVTPVKAPTSTVWVIGRTQANGPADYEAVHQVQAGYAVIPLDRWGQPPAPPPFRADPAVDMTTPPLDQVEAMTAVDFFAVAAELMKVHPPHPTDFSVLARIARIGLRPGGSFDSGQLDPKTRAALDMAPKAAQDLMTQAFPRLAKVVNGWSMNTDTMGVYGNFYLKRAIVARVGLGANQPEDAIYPVLVADADGAPLDGANDYLCHFEPGELPPADAFWSITMYDEHGFQAANPLNRFAIGDRDPLAYNSDGSLDIYVRHTAPGADKEPNWLPAPAGPLGITMRLYAPRPEALDGRWSPPPVRRVR